MANRKVLRISVSEAQRKPHAIPPFATGDKNALKINAFSFTKGNSAKTVPIGRYMDSMRKNRVYRSVAVKGKVRLYIEYYYLIPEPLRPFNNNQQWYRGRYFGGNQGGINQQAKKDPSFPNFLRDMVEFALEAGWNPFEYESELERTLSLEKTLSTVTSGTALARHPNVLQEISLDNALNSYLDHCREKGLRERSIGSYATLCNYLRDYFAGPEGPEIVDTNAPLFQPVGLLERKHLMDFLKETASEAEWSASRYNTMGSYLTGLFNWFAHEDVRYIEKAPLAKLPQRKTDEKMNTAYTDEQAIVIKKAMLAGGANGIYVHFFCEFEYYTCLRPVEEARVLQRKHLNFEQRSILVPGTISKNGKLYHIPMADELYDMLIAHGINKAPGDYFIFGPEHKPASKPPSKNYFAKLFRKIRDQPEVLAAGITPQHTIYSFKHTRACHLVIDGVPLAEIQRLLKHTTLAQLEAYLRDLGQLVSQITAKKARSF